MLLPTHWFCIWNIGSAEFQNANCRIFNCEFKKRKTLHLLLSISATEETDNTFESLKNNKYGNSGTIRMNFITEVVIHGQRFLVDWDRLNKENKKLTVKFEAVNEAKRS
jgi:hypothetical protein